MLQKRGRLCYESDIIRNPRCDLQVGEVVSSLKGGCLNAGDFIFPEIQMLQLRKLLKKAVRFDLVQFIVAQQPGANTQTGSNACRTKSRLSCHRNIRAYLRYACMVSLLLDNKKRAKLVLSVRYSITCFRLPAEQFIRYHVITMRRSINFANCALE